jgi:TRAP-type C4-dicarboxylate transport system permease small subunit
MGVNRKGILYRVRDAVTRVATMANMVGAAVLFALVAIMNSDVVARGVFHAPLLGVVELVIFALVLIVYLQLPDVVQRNRLTRSDGFMLFLAHRKSRFASILSRSIDGVAAMFFLMLFWAVWPEFLESFESCHFFTAPEFGPPPSGHLIDDFLTGMERCDYFGTPGIFTAPWWPAKLAIVFGVLFSAIVLLFKVFMPEPDGETFETGGRAE